MLAVSGDEELKKLLPHTVGHGAGVVPHINKALVPVKKVKKLKAVAGAAPPAPVAA